jgi:hypothetical protein
VVSPKTKLQIEHNSAALPSDVRKVSDLPLHNNMIFGLRPTWGMAPENLLLSSTVGQSTGSPAGQPRCGVRRHRTSDGKAEEIRTGEPLVSAGGGSAFRNQKFRLTIFVHRRFVL